MKHFPYVLYVGLHAQRSLCDKQNVLFYGTPRTTTKNELYKVILGTAACSSFELLALCVVPISIFYNLIGQANFFTQFNHCTLLTVREIQ